MVPGRVLLVDDDATTLLIMSAALRKAGYDVQTHDSGFGLAVAIRSYQPDIVLLDVDMPGLSGDRALEAANTVDHGLRGKVRFVLHSALPERQLARLVNNVGADGYLVKPIPPQDLADRLEPFTKA
jgi:CheY-like chemotaxis protein